MCWGNQNALCALGLCWASKATPRALARENTRGSTSCVFSLSSYVMPRTGANWRGGQGCRGTPAFDFLRGVGAIGVAPPVHVNTVYVRERMNGVHAPHCVEPEDGGRRRPVSVCRMRNEL